MFYGQADIPAMLAEFGVDVTIAGVTAKGIQDRQGRAVLDGEPGEVSDAVETVIVQTGAFAGLSIGVSIVVDGITFKVSDAQPFEDGALTRIDCSTS